MRNCITYIEKNILVKGERGAIMSKTRAKNIFKIKQVILTERVLRYEVEVKSLKPRIVALRRAEVSREKFSSETSEKTVYRKKVNVSV